jgi:uncharacterized coiled-coil protein SlyX
MADPNDAIVPILRNIQTNITRLEAKVDNQGETILDVSEKLDAMQSLMHFHLGLTTEHKHLIETTDARIKALEKRVEQLEGSKA